MSNNIVEIPENDNVSWWKNKSLIISIVSLVIILIVLLLLPPFEKNNFEVSIVKLPKQCKFRIIINQGENVADSGLFRFAANNGKWQRSNHFDSMPGGSYTIKVEHLTNRKAVFKYTFLNPFSFIPDCKAKPADPCDCQKLQIISATIEKLDGQNKVVVRTTLPKCNKLYSYTGKDGPFFPDSTFVVSTQSEFQVWIKSSQCPPIGYTGNPVRPVKSIPRPLTGKFYKESDVDAKPYPTNIGKDRSTLIQKLREDCQKAGVTGSPHISFIVTSVGLIEGLQVSGNQENKSKINNILEELGGWTSGEKDGGLVNTMVYIQL